MKKALQWSGFAVALGVLTVAYGIFLAGWWGLSNKQISLVWGVSIAVVLAIVALLSFIALLSGGRDRWTAWMLVGALLFFSSLLLFDIGILVFVPLGLGLVIYSLIKFFRSPKKSSTS